MKKFVLLVFIVLPIYFLFQKPNYSKCKKAYLIKNNHKIELDIAYTKTQKSIGLMFIRKLDENKGMIFVFDNDEEHVFWMKNTYIPLDIIFVSNDFRIVDIFENVRQSYEEEPDDRVERVYSHGTYVIEVNAGLVKKMGLSIGQKIKIKWEC